LARFVDPSDPEAFRRFEDHVFFDDTKVLVTEADEGTHLAKALGTAKAAILRNHGLLAVGRTVDEAVWWFVSMERCCQAQFLAETICKPLQIDTDNARATRAVNGSPTVGWIQCQPLWERIVREQPDLLN
jgi:ribulose-5-phosphate 4-epimerase/fuculose-1-phosphate aldolase